MAVLQANTSAVFTEEEVDFVQPDFKSGEFRAKQKDPVVVFQVDTFSFFFGSPCNMILVFRPVTPMPTLAAWAWRTP